MNRAFDAQKSDQKADDEKVFKKLQNAMKEIDVGKSVHPCMNQFKIKMLFSMNFFFSV